MRLVFDILNSHRMTNLENGLRLNTPTYRFISDRFSTGIVQCYILVRVDKLWKVKLKNQHL